MKAPTWDGLRPTSDKLRGTLFNILAPRIEGARVLDVFAGTGAVALEALSRGAALATCIESDRRAVQLIEENRDRCGVTDRCAIIRDAAERALSRPIAGGPFDVVVIDPPYDYAAMADIVAAAATHRASGGVMVVEHATRVTPPSPPGLIVTRTLRSGDSSLSFYA